MDRIKAIIALAVLVGCAARSARTADIRIPVVATPAAGDIVVAGSLPILVRLPQGLRFHRAAMRIGDGAPVGSPVVRRRWWAGKGVDLIARLPTVALSPGSYVLNVDLAPPILEHHRTADGVSLEPHSLSIAFIVAPRGPRVEMRAVDQNGLPRSARFQVFTSDGDPVDLGNAFDAASDPSGRDIPRRSLFSGPEGVGEFLARGEYEIWASGGIRDGFERRVVTISGPEQLTFVVPRIVDTLGEVSADFHVHTALSSDSFIPDRDRFLALDAAGVDVAVITDHNRVRNPDEPLQRFGLGNSVTGIAGAEIRLGPVGHSYGHANAFPLNPEHPAPVAGDRTPAESFAHWRQHHHDHPSDGHDGPLAIQINHPRGIQFRPEKQHRPDVHALFEETEFDPTVSIDAQIDSRMRARDSEGRTVLDVDAIELLNRFSIEGWMRVRADWFALLNRGHRITATGNSDSHTSQLEPVGFPVNLVAVEEGTGAEGVVDGLREGRVRVSNGPMVSLEIQGANASVRPSKTTHFLGTDVTAMVTVEHAGWADPAEVRLIVNGSVVAVETVPSTRRFEWSVPLKVSGDAWVIAEAGQPIGPAPSAIDSKSPYGVIAAGHYPIGFTNPVYLDAEGDDAWWPTGEQVGPAPQ